MSLKFGLIVNHNANRHRRNLVDMGALERAISGQGLLRFPENTDGSYSLVAEEFIGHNVDVVVSSGGDGTFLKVLSAYVYRTGGEGLPLFVVLKAGTVNVLANSAGYNFGPVETLEKLVGTPPGNLHIVEVGTLKVTSDGKTQYGSMVADGAVYEFIRIYNSGRFGVTSITKALKMLLYGSFSGDFAKEIVRSTSASLTIDGKDIKLGHTAMFVSGYKPSILGIKPFGWVDKEGGLYEAHTHVGRCGLLGSLPFLYYGRRSPSGNYSTGVERVKLSSDIEFGITLDGDEVTCRNLVIEKGPRIKLIVI